MKNNTMRFAAFGAAFIGMGVAMPQCPGEKALQQQVETLQASNVNMTQKLNALDGQVKAGAGDMTQMKQLVTQMATAVTAQKDALDRMDAAIKDLQAKVAALSTPHVKPAGKTKKKGK